MLRLVFLMYYYRTNNKRDKARESISPLGFILLMSHLLEAGTVAIFSSGPRIIDPKISIVEVLVGD